ncbi:MAG: M48 family metallopeptidase [Elusimicrobiota bacterium]|jgi:predicted metal-dependent hydrolase|nr:M48 family metallopeptidase [Elusimicrobiota bacterium]
MKILTINNIPIDAEWKKIKNIHLSIYPPAGRAHVSAPIWMSEDSVRLFLITKLNWLKKKAGEVLSQPRQTKREFVSGENHYYKGRRYIMRVIYRNQPPKIEIDGLNHINLYIRQTASAVQKAQALQEWYRRELKIILEPFVKKWESLMNVKASRWEVKRMKTLWGSCNVGKARILFNLELIKKPIHCIEYVVVHELAHLLENRHNSRFKSILDANLPNWRPIKEELNEFIV